ncbi:hypothetical protein C8J57DRAFT_1364714 [Mycena rebaudengoi]|nr:hypothetical protein C8J57DRAFT_1364714 [Mycena rebaudengoi]
MATARLNIQGSLAFLDTLKVQLPQASYNEFLDLMHRFRLGEIDTDNLLPRISDLFSGRPELVNGMSIFLPDGYSIGCSPDGKTITSTTPSGATTRTYP